MYLWVAVARWITHLTTLQHPPPPSEPTSALLLHDSHSLSPLPPTNFLFSIYLQLSTIDDHLDHHPLPICDLGSKNYDLAAIHHQQTLLADVLSGFTRFSRDDGPPAILMLQHDCRTPIWMP